METNHDLRNETMSGVEDPQKKEQKNMAWQKDEKEGVQSRGPDAREQLRMRG